jgi:flagellar basal-body rod protein FlgB
MISNNVANADTPNYKSTDISFEQQLLQAMNGDANTLQMDTTNPGHMSLGGGGLSGGIDDLSETVNLNDAALRNDGNNVDMDREMSRLSETGIRYEAVSSQIASRIGLMKTILNQAR